MSKHKTEQAVVFRIYTEDKDNLINIERIIYRQFKYGGFTVSYTDGGWKGERESSLIIEIIGEIDDKHKVLTIAGDIKNLNEQETVLVTTTNVFVNEIN